MADTNRGLKNTSPSTRLTSRPGPGGTGSSVVNNSSSPPSQQNTGSSRIMVVAVAVLFAVVIFIICLHIYAKWFWRHHGAALGVTRSSGSWRRRPNSQRRRSSSNHRTRQVVGDDHDPQHQQAVSFLLQSSVGLEKTVVDSLPTFVYKKPSDINAGVHLQEADSESDAPSTALSQPLECAVCLGEFQENETGRTLPKCAHAFHVDCIDMWLYSHSTCPLCRASAQPDIPASTESPAAELAQPGDVTAPVDHDNASTAAPPGLSSRDQQQQQQEQSSSRVTPDLYLRGSASGSLGRALTAREEEQTGADAPATDPATAAAATTTTGRSQQQLQQEVENGHHQHSTRNSKSLPAHMIPSNVLFWAVGVDTTSSVQGASSHHQQQLLRTVVVSAAAGNRSSSTGVQAPFQIAIDIPRGGRSGIAADQAPSSPSIFTPRSPMARFVSFKRLLSSSSSRGKNVTAVGPISSSFSSPSSPVFSRHADLERQAPFSSSLSLPARKHS